MPPIGRCVLLRGALSTTTVLKSDRLLQDDPVLKLTVLKLTVRVVAKVENC